MSSRPGLLPQALAAAALLASPSFAGDQEFCIGGTVVNSVTGQPIRRAAVSTPQSAALTDAAGAFHFCGLPAGAYYANAEKPGFTAAGTRVAVGPSREDLNIRLDPLAIVKGRVLDRDGNPVEGALVQLLSFAIGDGRRLVRVESVQSTDDRGEYRIPHIIPGRYLLRAAGWQGPQHAAKEPDPGQAFAPVYYGGSPDPASATVLSVEPGSETSGDFSVPLTASYRVQGALAGFSSNLPTTIELLGPGGEPGAAPAVFHAVNGTFEVNYAAPGSYLLRATQGEGAARLRGELPVQIAAADVTDLRLTLAGAAVLQGTVRVTAAPAPAPTSPNCSVRLSPSATAMYEDPLQSSTSEDGAFEIEGVLPGRYRVAMDCASGYIASVHAGGADLLAQDELVIPAGTAPPPLDAVLNTDGASIDVTASQDDGDTAPAWLVLMPDSGNDLYVRFALLKGKLSLDGIAPGDYHIYAWSGSPYAFEYANPSVRQAWAGRAVGVKVAAHDRQSVTLKVPAGEPQ